MTDTNDVFAEKAKKKQEHGSQKEGGEKNRHLYTIADVNNLFDGTESLVDFDIFLYTEYILRIFQKEPCSCSFAFLNLRESYDHIFVVINDLNPVLTIVNLFFSLRWFHYI